MNKQEKNIIDVITLDEIEDIVDIFVNKLYYTDKTITLISNKELIEYAMELLLADDSISVKKIDLELDDIEYMISVDNDGNMVVQPIVYYDDKYFKAIEYAFISMDGDVQQMTIDNLINRDVPVVLFGLNDKCDCDECEFGCQKYEKPTTSTTTTSAKSTYMVNGKEVNKETFDAVMSKFEDTYLDNVKDMLLKYSEFMDEMNEWRKLFW